MKTLLLLSSLFVGVIGVVKEAEARTPLFQDSQVYPHVAINGEQTKFTAVVNTDLAKNTIRADVYDDICNSFTAEPGQITCLAMAKHEQGFEAEIIDRKNDCGSVVYEAFTDNTPVDGLRVSIKTYDHSDRRCDDVKPFLKEVEATVFNLRTQTTTTYYFGAKK